MHSPSLRHDAASAIPLTALRVRRGCARAAALLALLAPLADAASAGPLAERMIERSAAPVGEAVLEEVDEAPTSAAFPPPGTRLIREVAYGPDAQQRFDVYAPSQTSGAPVLLMVHGGGWARGDKGSHGVVENKVARWVPRGFIVVSTNYRLLPAAGPVEQARDIARALAAAQSKAAAWGGDRNRFVLMGHSAGAHLVALLAASPALAREEGAAPWLGTVILDTAALDVVGTMEARHLPLYDRAFGSDPAYWRAASPHHALAGAAAPVLGVCSTRRRDSCPQLTRFAAKAAPLGMRVSVLKQNLSHRDINRDLGLAGSYTELVEAFIGTLDTGMARLLANPQADR